jgi:hypothetical protein
MELEGAQTWREPDGFVGARHEPAGIALVVAKDREIVSETLDVWSGPGRPPVDDSHERVTAYG